MAAERDVAIAERDELRRQMSEMQQKETSNIAVGKNFNAFLFLVFTSHLYVIARKLGTKST